MISGQTAVYQGKVFIGFKMPGRTIISAQAPLGAHPYKAVAILADGPDLIIAQAERIARIMAEMLEVPAYGIQQAQPIAAGPDPQKTLTVLKKAPDPIAAWAIRVIRIMAIGAKTIVGIEQTIQPTAFGTDP